MVQNGKLKIYKSIIYHDCPIKGYLMVKSLFFAKINEQKTTILSILGHFKRLEVNFFLNILAHSGEIFRKICGAFFVAKSQKPRNAVNFLNK